MKKKYIKPEINFESFTLSSCIAGSCEERTDTPSAGECGYQPEGYDEKIFVTGVEGCTEIHDEGMYNGLCYHVPQESYNLFNS